MFLPRSHRVSICLNQRSPGRSRIRCQRLPSPREAQWLDDLGSIKIGKPSINMVGIYIYIWFTYDLHIIYIWFTYDLHMIYIWFTYDLHIIFIWFTYYLHMIYILFTYYLHIIYILFTYYLHTIYILFSYYLHIIYILFTYYLHIIYILFTYDDDVHMNLVVTWESLPWFLNETAKHNIIYSIM